MRVSPSSEQQHFFRNLPPLFNCPTITRKFKKKKQTIKSLLTKLATSMIPSSTGWVQSTVNFNCVFFFCCFFFCVKINQRRFNPQSQSAQAKFTLYLPMKSNFSLQYPYNLQKTGNKNTKSYQVEVNWI